MTKLFFFIQHIVYLFSTDFSINIKIKLSLIYFQLGFKSLFLSRLLKNNKISLYGLNIFGFSDKSNCLLFGEIFVKNEYKSSTKNPEPLIIDCGANIGTATLYFKRIYPNSEIHSFEPDSNVFRLLKNNIQTNNIKNVHLYKKAVSDKDGFISFFSDNLPGCTMSTNSNRQSAVKSKVESISLSSFIKNNFGKRKIDLLKVDIEGGEDVVFKDLDEKDMFTNIQEIILEYHHNIEKTESNLDTLLGIIKKHGYKYQIDASCYPIDSKDKFQDIHIHAYKF